MPTFPNSKNLPFRDPSILIPFGVLLYTEQMDAEGLGRKLLLTPSGDPRRTSEKQTVGTETASQKMLSLRALSGSLNAGTAKGGCLGRGEAFGGGGGLRRSVPQNGRLHLHIIKLLKRHPNGYQHKRVPKCLVFKKIPKFWHCIFAGAHPRICFPPKFCSSYPCRIEGISGSL